MQLILKFLFINKDLKKPYICCVSPVLSTLPALSKPKKTSFPDF